MKHFRNDPLLKQRRRDLRKNQTEAEETLWRRLRNNQFSGKKFFRQYSIGPYILDFYCPQSGLAIELDGSRHTEDNVREYDTERSAYLLAQGISVLRFWNHEVLTQTENVLKRILIEVTPSNILHP
ncbi:MAG: endonuclease domain-containing protein [Nitrospirota bacterium]